MLVSHSNGLETYYLEIIKSPRYAWVDSPSSRWYQFNQTPLFNNAFTQVDAIITVSENERNYALKNQYKDEAHIVSIENSLLDEFIGLKVDFQRKPIIGYCGSWILRKGIKLIESDIARILAEFTDCYFKLIGVGKDFRKEAYFPSTLCSRIEVIPFVESKYELRNLYQALSILVSPSIYESFGLVIAEAMACGCAIVASNTGFSASLIPGKEAIIIEKSVSPALYEGIKKLLTNEPLRLKIANNGYRRVQSLRWNFAVDQLESAYSDWLKELRNARS